MFNIQVETKDALLHAINMFNIQVETKDALLHAINEEYVEAVEVLLEHEESIHRDGELWVTFN